MVAMAPRRSLAPFSPHYNQHHDNRHHNKTSRKEPKSEEFQGHRFHAPLTSHEPTPQPTGTQV